MIDQSKPVRRLSQVQFFKACEVFKKNKQWFLDTRPTAAIAAAKMAELTGLGIATTTMTDLREACGINWQTSYSRDSGHSGFSNYTAIRTLTTAVKILYAKLGEELPSGVANLVDHFANATTPSDERQTG